MIPWADVDKPTKTPDGQGTEVVGYRHIYKSITVSVVGEVGEASEEFIVAEK